MLTLADLRSHKFVSDCFVAVDGSVYDFSRTIVNRQLPYGVERSILEQSGSELKRGVSQINEALNFQHLKVGNLASKSRLIKIVNSLTGNSVSLWIPSTFTILEITQAYAKFNFHVAAYDLRFLGKLLDLSKTLDEQGITDQTAELKRVGLKQDEHAVVLHAEFRNGELDVA
jgi:Cytochrome b5-like Heme/Steroid binding domain